MSKVAELFGHSTLRHDLSWSQIVSEQQCPFLEKKCFKTRKSEPSVSIGSCSILAGVADNPVIICPARLTQRRQIFTDCIHLLTQHEPGNELHLVSEVNIPGGYVDFFLVSVGQGIIKDFVGIELQALDTTGTVWPERQRLLVKLGVPANLALENKPFGINWKMTAKTILVQIHHKIQTFEHLNKKLVLVVQDSLLAYMEREFQFDHVHNPPTLGDSMHFHAYSLSLNAGTSNDYQMMMKRWLSTDAQGVTNCLRLRAEARVELSLIIETLQRKISATTLFSPIG